MLETTKEGRNINRHYYSLAEIAEETERPVVKALFDLLRFRNTSPAFDLAGEIQVKTPSPSELVIVRTGKEGIQAVLNADLVAKTFTISENGNRVF